MAVKICCGTNSSGGLAVIPADLIHSQGNRLVLVGILALDHQHRNAVDKKDNILPCAAVAVVKSPLLGDLVNVLLRTVIIDQDQVSLTPFLVVRELSSVPQVFDEFPVAVDVRCEDGGTVRVRPLRLRHSAD